MDGARLVARRSAIPRSSLNLQGKRLEKTTTNIHETREVSMYILRSTVEAVIRSTSKALSFRFDVRLNFLAL